MSSSAERIILAANGCHIVSCSKLIRDNSVTTSVADSFLAAKMPNVTYFPLPNGFKKCHFFNIF